MPLYEYQCESCGNVFEVRQKFADEPLTTHEACGGPVHRILSAPALQFKGSGWYVTDYARSGSSSSASSAQKSESGSGSKSDTKSSSDSSSSSSSTSSTTSGDKK